MSNVPLVRMGIDIGFGDVKAVFSRFVGNGRFETENIKFPSAIARVKNKVISGLDDAQVEYEFEKRKYLIGKDAISSANIIPTRDIDFIMEFSPLFIFRAMEFVVRKISHFHGYPLQPDRDLSGTSIGVFHKQEKATFSKTVQF